MHEAALQAEVDPDRLSFTHALEVVREAVGEFQIVAEAQVADLYKRMLHDIAAKRVPERQPRVNRRVVKQKMSKFKLKRAEHYRPPKPSRSYREAVVIQPEPPDEPGVMLELPAHPLWSGAVLLELSPPVPCRI